MSEITKPSNPQDDWKFWMVVNPATWIMPILMSVTAIALIVHIVVFAVGLGWVAAK